MIAALWLSEFVLEFVGARLAVKKGFLPLGVFLGLRAFADIVCALIQYVFAPSLYPWAWYAQALTQYIVFTFLIVSICARLLKADRHTGAFYPAAIAGLMGLAIVFFHSRSFTMVNVLHFAAGTYMILGVLLCLGLAMSEAREWIWYGIAALVLACSNGLLSGLQAAHYKVTTYYPVGEIVALLIWVATLWPQGTWAFMTDVKFSFPPKLRCRAVWVDEERR